MTDGTHPAADVLAERALALLAAGWVTPDRLSRAIGALAGGDLVRVEPTAAAVLEVLGTAARRAGAVAAPALVAATRERLSALGAVLHVVSGAGYPSRLATAWPLQGAPLWLAVRAPDGRLPEGPAVAVVGTRHPTLDGLRTAEALGRLLAQHGVVVVSGMARGIDQAAHRGALDAGGRTVAVLGAGFAVDYPRGDGALREEIAASGGLATELAPADPPRPRHFLARNRIVSGLADAVVVVEGGTRSGALVTARWAGEQGRDLWAVPGSLHAPTSRAPLDLVRDGAQVVTRLEDVVEAVTGATGGPTGRQGDPAPPPDLTAPARDVLALLSATPAAPAALVRASGHPLPVVLAAGAELTTSGLAASSPRGLVRLR